MSIFCGSSDALLETMQRGLVRTRTVLRAHSAEALKAIGRVISDAAGADNLIARTG